MLPRFFRINLVGNRHRSLFHSQKKFYSYESDGKTTMTFLNKESEDQLLISAFNKFGFRLNSGLFVVGPVIMFPKTILSWNVADDNDINEDSLALFCNLEPKVDVLVIGLSDVKTSFNNQSYYMEKLMLLKKLKLNFELLPTEKAIATYNFLCAENRYAAAALIPPKVVEFRDYDVSSFNIKRWEGKDDYLLGDDVEQVKELEDNMSESPIAPHLRKKATKKID